MVPPWLSTVEDLALGVHGGRRPGNRWCQAASQWRRPVCSGPARWRAASMPPCICIPRQIPKVRHIVFSCVACRRNHAFDAASAKAARNDDTVAFAQNARRRSHRSAPRNRSSGYPPCSRFHKPAWRSDSATDRYGIVQLDVFSDKADDHLFFTGSDTRKHVRSIRSYRVRAWQASIYLRQYWRNSVFPA